MSQIVYKERKNTNCRKWDTLKEKFGMEDLLPLWIADMDFEIPECVKEALREYIDFGVFGYYTPPVSYYEAFINWEEKYHDYKVKQEWVRFAPGVVPGFNWLLHVLTEAGDSVIIMEPVYYPFREAIVNNGRNLVENHLVQTETNYRVDYEDFERKIIENDVKMFIFCNPHNPVGHVWTKDEIKKILDICKKHHVYVLADEIHQDLIMKGYKKVTAATVGDYDKIIVTLTAATKTFNLASVQNAILVIPDEKIRAKYDTYLDQELRVRGGNAFGYIAVQSAYENGRGWLEELLEIIESNYNVMKKMLEEALPEVWISELQCTYLMWIDFGKYIQPNEMEDVIQSQCGLAIDYGSWFGGEKYAGFIRVNLATKQENIIEAAERIIKVLKDK